jgi:hypothetical protein
VWSMSREVLKALQQCSIHSSRAKLVDELVIVDSELLPITRDGTLYVPGCHDLFVRCQRICRLDHAGRQRGGSPTGLEPRSRDEDRKKDRLTYPTVTEVANFSARLSGSVFSSDAISIKLGDYVV